MKNKTAQVKRNEEITAGYKAGKSIEELAKIYALSYQRIYKVLKYESKVLKVKAAVMKVTDKEGNVIKSFAPISLVEPDLFHKISDKPVECNWHAGPVNRDDFYLVEYKGKTLACCAGCMGSHEHEIMTAVKAASKKA